MDLDLVETARACSLPPATGRRDAMLRQPGSSIRGLAARRPVLMHQRPPFLRGLIIDLGAHRPRDGRANRLPRLCRCRSCAWACLMSGNDEMPRPDQLVTEAALTSVVLPLPLPAHDARAPLHRGNSFGFRRSDRSAGLGRRRRAIPPRRGCPRRRACGPSAGAQVVVARDTASAGPRATQTQGADRRSHGMPQGAAGPIRRNDYARPSAGWSSIWPDCLPER